MSEIVLQDVSVLFTSGKNEVVALHHANATFGDGINVIVGPSGCGKTTLLKIILGLVEYEGEIL